jgi:hypothetical protein
MYIQSIALNILSISLKSRIPQDPSLAPSIAPLAPIASLTPSLLTFLPPSPLFPPSPPLQVSSLPPPPASLNYLRRYVLSVSRMQSQQRTSSARILGGSCSCNRQSQPRRPGTEDSLCQGSHSSTDVRGAVAKLYSSTGMHCHAVWQRWCCEGSGASCGKD